MRGGVQTAHRMPTEAASSHWPPPRRKGGMWSGGDLRRNIRSMRRERGMEKSDKRLARHAEDLLLGTQSQMASAKLADEHPRRLCHMPRRHPGGAEGSDGRRGAQAHQLFAGGKA